MFDTRKVHKLKEIRALHSKARATWLILDDMRKQNSLGKERWLNQVLADNRMFRSWDTDLVLMLFPEWGEENQKSLDALDDVVRTLDKFARPRKQVYGGV